MAENAKKVTRFQIPRTTVSLATNGMEVWVDDHIRLDLKTSNADDAITDEFTLHEGIVLRMNPFCIENVGSAVLTLKHQDRTLGMAVPDEEDFYPGKKITEIEGRERFIEIADKQNKVIVAFEIWFNQ